ncbi:hypothetical protein BRE01_06580 [Brevibacillus reuszeri]|uniref:Uncharacterized protein n=1 Tax=Brevibacillus reuszeri TaxID=54915 RepID=A0ABQ0TGD2_9BACL|nr:hypothetical protein BRE01_06580 [Brevibacillus reuszeri]
MAYTYNQGREMDKILGDKDTCERHPLKSTYMLSLCPLCLRGSQALSVGSTHQILLSV